MPLVSTRGVILQVFPYSETSKILRVLTPDLGVRSVIAKGALRPKSRFGGLLEPFTEGGLEFLLREGRDLHTLGRFDLIKSRQGVGRSLVAFAGASLIAEIILRSATEEPQSDLFEAVIEALDDITDGGESAGVRALSGVWRVVSLLGYQPQLDSCVTCGRSVQADEPTRFNVDGGGIACVGCRQRGRIIQPSVRTSITDMLSRNFRRIPEGDLPVHRALLRAFLSAHLGSDRPLRALDLFGQELT